MSEEEYIDWIVPECENCERTAYKALWKEGSDLPVKWLCVGNIPKPNDPTDTHDIVNKIRMCLDVGKTDPVVYEWTPHESSLVSIFLGMAISNELYNNQPYLNNKMELVFPENIKKKK